MNYGMILNIFGLSIFAMAFFVWQTAKRMAEINPHYFRTRDGLLHWWDITSQFEALRIVFDLHLPKPEHGLEMRRRIYAARVMYALFLIGATLFFYIFLTHPQLLFKL